MQLNEDQLRELAENFMPRVKAESINAMVDALCHNLSVLAAAQKNGVSHQSLAKNLAKLKILENKVDLNKKELMDMIWRSPSIRKIYLKALNQGFWEDFPDEGLDKLIKFFQHIGIMRIADLKSIIEQMEPEIDDFFKDLYDQHKQVVGRHWRISFCFVVQLLLILKYSDKVDVECLVESGWDDSIAKVVIDVANVTINRQNKNPKRDSHV
ncbi:hypothetical protein ACSZM9_04315 [Aeromonas hydrophila]|uniref:hypothetical protein n=1 Tax=Aeromonas hydrophila TaxID=644 RepID=UPI003EC7B290